MNQQPHPISTTAPATALPPINPDDTTAEDFARPAHPTVLQQRIRDLERELRRIEAERDQLKRDNLLLADRNRGFERLLDSITRAYDALADAMDSLTSRPSQTAATEPR